MKKLQDQKHDMERELKTLHRRLRVGQPLTHLSLGGTDAQVRLWAVVDLVTVHFRLLIQLS